MIIVFHFQIPKSKAILHPPHVTTNTMQGFTVQLLNFLKDKHCKFELGKLEVFLFSPFIFKDLIFLSQDIYK